MKILYLHQYFKTPEEGGAIRSYHIASALAKAGHQVEVISAHNEANSITKKMEGFTVHYLPVPYDNSLSPLRRKLAFINFLWKAYKKASSIPADLCYATSTPLTIGLLALLLKKRRGLPFIFEVRDLWPEAPIQLGYIKGERMKKWLRKLELKTYEAAEHIIALSVGMAGPIKKMVGEKKVSMVPNMSDCDYFSPNPERKPQPFTVAYTGTLGKANRLEYLLNVANLCQAQGLDIQFKICGSGAEETDLKKQAKTFGLTNTDFLGSLNKEEIKKVMDESDAVYISFDQFPILQTNSPNKFFDGLAAGKLMILNVQGWLRMLVEQNRCGFYHHPRRPESFIQKITQFLNDAEHLKTYQQNARRLGEESFSKTKLTAQIVNLVEGLTK